MQRDENLEKIGGEVYAVLKNVPEEQYNKISSKIREIIEEYAGYSKDIIIDRKRSLKEQNISKQAKDIIFVIAYNYWLTEKEKENALNVLKLNEEKLRKQQDIEEIFKKRQEVAQSKLKNDNVENNKSMVVYKKNLFSRIIENIKNFFRKS